MAAAAAAAAAAGAAAAPSSASDAASGGGGSRSGGAPAAAATTPADLARIAKEAEGIVTELRAALETESGLLKSLNEKLAALHA